MPPLRGSQPHRGTTTPSVLSGSKPRPLAPPTYGRGGRRRRGRCGRTRLGGGGEGAGLTAASLLPGGGGGARGRHEVRAGGGGGDADPGPFLGTPLILLINSVNSEHPNKARSLARLQLGPGLLGGGVPGSQSWRLARGWPGWGRAGAAGLEFELPPTLPFGLFYILFIYFSSPAGRWELPVAE